MAKETEVKFVLSGIPSTGMRSLRLSADDTAAAPMPLDIAVVLDTSSSMNKDGRWDRFKASNCLASLPIGSRVRVVTYAKEAHLIHDAVLKDDTDRNVLSAIIENISCCGMTNFEDAMTTVTHCWQDSPPTSGSSVVTWMFTDGKITAGSRSAVDIAARYTCGVPIVVCALEDNGCSTDTGLLSAICAKLNNAPFHLCTDGEFLAANLYDVVTRACTRPAMKGVHIRFASPRDGTFSGSPRTLYPGETVELPFRVTTRYAGAEIWDETGKVSDVDTSVYTDDQNVRIVHENARIPDLLRRLRHELVAGAPASDIRAICDEGIRIANASQKAPNHMKVGEGDAEMFRAFMERCRRAEDPSQKLIEVTEADLGAVTAHTSAALASGGCSSYTSSVYGHSMN